MKSVLGTCWTGVCGCLRAAWSVILWSVWLSLVILLIAQITLLVRRELSVPAWIRRDLEARLEPLGLRADCRKITFDPAGRILLEEVSLRDRKSVV